MVVGGQFIDQIYHEWSGKGHHIWGSQHKILKLVYCPLNCLWGVTMMMDDHPDKMTGFKWIPVNLETDSHTKAKQVAKYGRNVPAVFELDKNLVRQPSLNQM
jgi:hypothetical protein